MHKQELISAVDDLRPLIEDIANDLYSHPEVGLAEAYAAERLVAILSQHGFHVETGSAGLSTAFVARAGHGRPVIAFMAEYDALPAIGHGCGHNLMAACAVAAGIACNTALPADRYDMSWEVIGTPAEETVGGKVIMADAGVFDDVDAALIAHPGQRNSLGGASWASHPVEFTFYGRPSHAGGNPQGGINALDACATAYLSIRNLKNQLRDDVRLAGIITQGGDAQNIVPEKCTVRFTVRSKDWKYLEDTVLPKVVQIAQGVSLAFGTRLEWHHHESLFREQLEHPVLKQLALRNFEYLGQEVPPPPEGMGGGTTDVGAVTWVTPSIQIGYRIGDQRGHSREMAEQTITAEGIDATLMAAKVLALSAFDLAADPKLLAEAHRYLESRKRS